MSENSKIKHRKRNKPKFCQKCKKKFEVRVQKKYCKIQNVKKK